MSHRLLFYVSGHGYGHARRVTQVVRALGVLSPETEVFLRSSAPARVFEPIPPGRIEPTRVDAGMAEDGPLAIDPAGTLDRLIELLDRRETVVLEEADAVRRIAPDLLVTDVPFLAGDVAEATGVPCVGMSNFTWDWICDPLLGEGTPFASRYAAVRRRMVEGYGKMRAVLQLPFGDVSEGFRERIAVPLMAGRSRRDPSEVLRRLGVEAGDGRPRVLVGMRGGVSAEALRAAAEDAAECLFFVPQGVPPDMPANVWPAVLGPGPEGLDFSDLVAVSEVVVSKLGYGIVADCLAAGAGLLWPPRTGFREDEFTAALAPRYMRAVPLPVADFLGGRWGAMLRAVLAQPRPAETLPTDGAEVCAAALVKMLANH